jgi:hypothetical protein
MSHRLTRWCAAATIVLCLGYTAAALLIRPSLLPDPSWALLVPNSARDGAAWNHVIEPNPDNIALDASRFLSVMSPGQYVLPDLLSRAGLSTGAAIATVSITASLLGLLAWYWFFRVLGYGAAASTIACLLLAASRNYNQPFLTYPGGEVLAFAAFPVLAGFTVRLRDSKWLPLYAVAAMFLVFFAKNSVPIYMGAWIAAQSLVTWSRHGFGRANLLLPAATVLAAGGSMVAIYVGYSSRGWSPLSYEPAFNWSLSSYLVPWAMPALAATAWDDVFSWVFQHPSGPVLAFEYKQSVLLMGGIAAASIVAAIVAVRREAREPVWVLFVYSVGVVAALDLLLNSGDRVGHLDLSRHYRWVGYLWLPLLVQYVLSSRRAVALALAAILAVPSAYAILSFGANWRRHYQQRASHSERLQVTQSRLTPRLVNALSTLDRELPGGTTLVVTCSPMYGLEFQRTRVLATNIVVDPLDRRPPNRGTVDNLILIADLPGMSEAKRAQWLASFPSYREWEWLDVDDHRFYVPAGQTVNQAWLTAHLR